MEFVGAVADEAEAMGDSPRHSPGPNKYKKSSIPGSLSSLGMVPGTDHEFFNRLFKDFMIKWCQISPSKPLSSYHVHELSKVIFPDSVHANQEDRINERRLKANSCPYNFVSGAAGILALWHLKPVDPTELSARLKKEEYDPDDIINIDKSAHLTGKSAKKDKILVTRKGKLTAKKRSQSNTTRAANNGEVPATLGYTLVTSAKGNSICHVTHVVDDQFDRCFFERLYDTSTDGKCLKFALFLNTKTDQFP